MHRCLPHTDLCLRFRVKAEISLQRDLFLLPVLDLSTERPVLPLCQGHFRLIHQPVWSNSRRHLRGLYRTLWSLTICTSMKYWMRRKVVSKKSAVGEYHTDVEPQIQSILHSTAQVKLHLVQAIARCPLQRCKNRQCLQCRCLSLGLRPRKTLSTPAAVLLLNGWQSWAV
jgi:hypothetical protein